MTPAPRALKIYSHTWEWGSSATAHTRGAPLRMLLGTMYLLFSWIYWGSLVYISSAQFSLAAPTQDKEQKDIVVKFIDVYERSRCQVRKTLVNVYQEYPDEVELIFKPSYVELDRCSGCCTDETLECVPMEWSNITMQLLRGSHLGQWYHLKSFLEHKRCECRPKEIKEKQEKKAKRGKGLKRKRKKIRYKSQRFHCEPCTDTERRKHLFVQDPQTCKCSCKNTDSRCKTKQLELNERTCRCEKPRR